MEKMPASTVIWQSHTARTTLTGMEDSVWNWIFFFKFYFKLKIFGEILKFWEIPDINPILRYSDTIFMDIPTIDVITLTRADSSWLHEQIYYR